MADQRPDLPGPDPLGITARSHALRASLSEEMHLRKLPPIRAPARLLQIVALSDEAGIAASHDHVATYAAARGLALPDDARYFVVRGETVDLVWERHTEFATYTFIAHTPLPEPEFGVAPFGAALPDWLADMPGRIIRASQIVLLAAGDPPDPAFLATHFDMDDVICCDLAEGRARLWSNFRLHEDGFGRLLLQDRGLQGGEIPQLIQRVQELGNYRKLALLGLPVAQRLTPEVSRLEQRLAALTGAVAARVSDDASLLDELGAVSTELARLSAETRYRMSATRAYAQLSTDRLDLLQVTPVRGFQTLHDFTERRLVPAVRTCESFSKRLEDLSQRVAWTSSLLRTRVDTALGQQNRGLLEAMNRRARIQLRLQQTVEGLSVAAVSYYVVGLLGYVFKALHHVWPALDVELATGISVPFVILVGMLSLRRIHRGLHRDAAGHPE